MNNTDPDPTQPDEAKELMQNQHRHMQPADLEQENAELRQKLTKAIAERDASRASKRPFSDKLAQEVIDGQVKRITELEAKSAELRTTLEKTNVELAELRAWTDALEGPRK